MTGMAYCIQFFHKNVICNCTLFRRHYFTKSSPLLFDLKLVYSYVIEVADSESELGLHAKALVSEIFALYHLLKYAQGRAGRRGH